MLLDVTIIDRSTHPHDRASAAAPTTAAPPADQAAAEAAVAHFAAKLRFETDPSDVAAARAAGAGQILIDVRDAASWAQGHVPGALHLPTRDITARLR